MIDYVPIKYADDTIVRYYENIQSPLFIGIDSTKIDNNTRKLIDTVKPSGIIILSKNVKNESQLSSLISSIKDYGKNRGINIKFAIDEEIGSISRIEGYNREFKESNRNSKDIEKQAIYLKNLGIDINLSPVADIGYDNQSPIYFRTYGNTSKEVSKQITNHIEIQQRQGISNTVKHYPGLGRSSEDTHNKLATVTITKQEWLQNDAQPFISAIKSNVEYIMTGHVTYPLIDKSIATYSKEWNKILRKDLNYNKNIIADDLKMEGANINDTICSKSNNSYAKRIYTSNKINNYSIIILNQNEMINTYREWIRIEMECLK